MKRGTKKYISEAGTFIMSVYINEDKKIDLKRLAVKWLKHWRMIGVAAMVGAVLMVCVCAISGGETVDPQDSLATTNQQQIDANNSSIAEYEAHIEKNNENIESSDEILAKMCANADEARARLEIQRECLSTYESLISEANRLKDSVSSQDRVEQVMEISDLTEKVLEITEQIEAIEASIVECETQMDEYRQTVATTLPETNEYLQKKIDELRAENEELQATVTAFAKGGSVGDYLKYAALGLALGALTVAGYVLVVTMFGSKVEDAEALKERYGLPVLADLHVTKSKYNTGFDRRIEKQNGEKRTINAEAEYKLLAAKLYAINPEENGDILVVSTADSSYTSALCDGIKKHLQKELEVNAVGDPVRDAGAAQAVKNACVVLAERIDESAYADIDRMLEQLSLSNAKVLGCVLL